MKENVLKNNGLKSTEGRKLILDILESAYEPMTADEIFVLARQKRELNFSTVYRTLSTLAEKSIIMKNIGGDGKSYYQLSSEGHCHYLVCSECHRRIAIDGCPFEEMRENIANETGFHITGHNFEFVGECPECFEKKN